MKNQRWIDLREVAPERLGKAKKLKLYEMVFPLTSVERN